MMPPRQQRASQGQSRRTIRSKPPAIRQGNALLIEARAQMRLADEYDAAQARGEAARHSSGNPKIVPNKNDLPKTAADLGLDRKVILEARRVRDAEKAKPGIVEQTLAAAGEPTRARLKRAVDGVLAPQRPTAQGEVAAKAVAQEEGRRREIAEPNSAELLNRIHDLEAESAAKDEEIVRLKARIANLEQQSTANVPEEGWAIAARSGEPEVAARSLTLATSPSPRKHTLTEVARKRRCVGSMRLALY
jgi:hypothetical protein